MYKDIFGLTKYGIEKHIKIEKKHAESLAEVYNKLIEQIKNTSEPDGWQKLILFSKANELLKNVSPYQRTSLLFYLRRNPNIISKLPGGEPEKSRIKPFLYKWVSEEEKISLGVKAYYFKQIDADILKYISENSKYVDIVDILTVLEMFTSEKKDSWQEITTFDIALFSGVPVENTRAALNELLRLKLLVFGFTEGRQRKGRLKQFVRFTPTEEDYNAASNGEGIEAVKIVNAKDVVHESFKFTSLEYFYSLVGVKIPVQSKFYSPAEEKETPAVEKTASVSDEKILQAISELKSEIESLKKIIQTTNLLIFKKEDLV